MMGIARGDHLRSGHSKGQAGSNRFSSRRTRSRSRGFDVLEARELLSTLAAADHHQAAATLAAADHHQAAATPPRPAIVERHRPTGSETSDRMSHAGSAGEAGRRRA